MQPEPLLLFGFVWSERRLATLYFDSGPDGRKRLIKPVHPLSELL